jgi:Uma2 family endonuclease
VTTTCRKQVAPRPPPPYPSRVATARRLHHTYEEYLDVLEISRVKLEYCDGEIYAMAGGTPAHAELAASITRLLGNALLGRCRIASSDLKVRIEATDLSTFPDATVVCGEREVSPIDRNAIINPSVLVEVTSNSSEDYDRGEKLNHYQQCPSVRAVIVVSHRRPQVTVVARASDHWETREYRAGEELELTDPRLRVSVDESYAGIVLDAS